MKTGDQRPETAKQTGPGSGPRHGSGILVESGWPWKEDNRHTHIDCYRREYYTAPDTRQEPL